MREGEGKVEEMGKERAKRKGEGKEEKRGRKGNVTGMGKKEKGRRKERMGGTVISCLKPPNRVV